MSKFEETILSERKASLTQKRHSLHLDESLASRHDSDDPLASYRTRFHIPKATSGSKDCIYLCGNSLGLQPKTTKDYILEELEAWQVHGVEAHFTGSHPWVSYDEVCVPAMAALVGAKVPEVILMNTLTVNLHLMLTTFYQPTELRHKILVEDGAFPSDIIALISQVKLRGYDPSDAIILLKPKQGEELLREDVILQTITERGSEIALIMLGGVNYFTGQVMDIQKITEVGHAQGCRVGFDLAHAVGNISLQLNSWGPDFAVWCTYKYLNSGPGGIGGCFVHERHLENPNLPRMSGWWSHKKETRFLMKPELILDSGASSFQLSNPSILCLASLRASLELYEEVGMKAFVTKSKLLTGYLFTLLEEICAAGQKFRIISPSHQDQRGCQLSLVFSGNAKTVCDRLRTEGGVIVDYRQPNCIRVAPNPFYNSYSDVLGFVKVLNDILN